MALTSDAEEKATLKRACLNHLEKLQKVDGLRINRYKQLADELASK